MTSDELSVLIKHHALQAVIDQRPFVYGHIANYDAATHRVRCIIPSMTDDNGTPLLSPWMPMATMSAATAGNGATYGGQIIYQGGATAQNPTSGEQVVIGLFDRQRGVAVCLGTTFNGSSASPATKLPEGASPNAAGDFLWSNPSGSLIRVRANGDVEVWSAAKLIANITGDADATIGGNATVNITGSTTVISQGTVSVIAPLIKLAGAVGDTLQNLCTTAFRTWAASHVHGNSGPPSTQPPANGLTTIVQGE